MMMVYREGGDFDKVITDWEHIGGWGGPWWIRHHSQVNSATISGSKDSLNMKSFYRPNIPRFKRKKICSGFQFKKKNQRFF